MRYVDEYRGEAEAQRFANAIRQCVTRPWTLMEICGGQTHSIIRYGIDQLLPPEVSLVHGPGCPVCVTPVELIDRAIALARVPEVIFTSFGDMLRVPGSTTDLLRAKSEGADVRMVYSPLDALGLAQQNPGRQVVFFAIGFETTAPASAMAVWQAAEQGLRNFTVLSAHVLVPPAMEAILSAPDNVVQGFLAAGHVCTVMGTWQYEPIAERFGVPIVVTGFEPLDLLQGLHMVLTALQQHRAGVENQYRRSVRREGNVPAQRLLDRVFEPCDRQWRGIGTIASSGLRLVPALAAFDAERRFDVRSVTAEESPECIAGSILRGIVKPVACPAFGTRCTPERPLGAPMVSSEGACAAYYRYGRTGRAIASTEPRTPRARPRTTPRTSDP
ncbi:MAG: hydrogenase formation protein HypD [Polyangiaceae bacterium]|nr:hydrogenase formation protein HypD [Polyangiaceae bacterium]